MRKILSLLLAMVVVLSLVACSDAPKKETYQPEATTQAATPKDETFGINEVAVFEDMKIVATEITESKGDDFFNPEKGKIFVGVHFEIENTSDEEQSISSLLMFDGYVDDVKCDYSFTAACAFDEGTLDGTILPGKKLVGWYALEVPENWKSIELMVKSNWLSNTNAVFKFDK